MDDLGDKLNAILNDPEQFGRIARMAQSIMGGDSGAPAAKAPPEKTPELAALAARVSAAMGAGGGSDKRALLEAMKPYLSEKRRGKMDKALRLARLASMAQLLVGELGEDGDV